MGNVCLQLLILSLDFINILVKGQAHEHPKRDSLKRSTNAPVPSSLLKHHGVQILIGFLSDTMSLGDNNSFVPTKSESFVSKGESFVISLIILKTNRAS